MTYTYVFSSSDRAQARRSDGATVPWDATKNRPRDINGRAGQIWHADGSPIPAPYVVPEPSPDQVRRQVFLDDPDRQALLAAIANATPAEIKAYINNNVTDLNSAKAFITKLSLLVALTLRS